MHLILILRVIAFLYTSVQSFLLLTLDMPRSTEVPGPDLASVIASSFKCREATYYSTRYSKLEHLGEVTSKLTKRTRSLFHTVM